eukprot:1910024-Prorocentrum_lima.AAC.1
MWRRLGPLWAQVVGGGEGSERQHKGMQGGVVGGVRRRGVGAGGWGSTGQGRCWLGGERAWAA